MKGCNLGLFLRLNRIIGKWRRHVEGEEEKETRKQED
jgi:hypothetical protein